MVLPEVDEDGYFANETEALQWNQAVRNNALVVDTIIDHGDTDSSPTALIPQINPNSRNPYPMGLPPLRPHNYRPEQVIEQTDGGQIRPNFPYYPTREAALQGLRRAVAILEAAQPSVDFASRLALEALQGATTQTSQSTQTPIVMYSGRDFGHDDPSIPPGTPPFRRLGSPLSTMSAWERRMTELIEHATDEDVAVATESLPVLRRRYSWIAGVMGSFRGTTASGTEVHYTGNVSNTGTGPDDMD